LVLTTLDSFMLVLALAQPLLGIHFTLGGALRGAGDTVSPLLAAAVGNWLLRVPLAVCFGSWLHLNLVWLWFALVADHALRALWMVGAFRRERWLPEELRPAGARLEA
jgi:Na+-driven multidrug efflux pump